MPASAPSVPNVMRARSIVSGKKCWHAEHVVIEEIRTCVWKLEISNSSGNGNGQAEFALFITFAVRGKKSKPSSMACCTRSGNREKRRSLIVNGRKRRGNPVQLRTEAQARRAD